MDDELRVYLEGMEARLSAAIAESHQGLLGLMNNQHERLIEDISGVRRDFQSTKGFLLEDAIVTGRRLLTIEERLSRLERK